MSGVVIHLEADGVSAADVVAVARGDVFVELGSSALAAMDRSAAVVAALAASDEPA